ncbi:MAG: PaaI family thioesterase [Desulfobacteraceae bacterium]|nr:PaaI family thioesterase [Desulfobacteraceae bacterium]MBC2757268.1 PaaI family thioesterase [Desulfobacteraceae bacterium]
MKKEIPNPFLDGKCFFCGSKNPEGLKLKFYVDDETEEISTEYLPTAPFIGQGNIFHGGIQMGLLDEIMGWTSYVATGENAVSSEINVKFLKPVYLGKQVRIVCRRTSREGSKFFMHARIETLDSTVCAVATGTYHVLSKDRYERLIQGQ